MIAFQSTQRVVPDLGASDDDAEEDSQMRAALRESREGTAAPPLCAAETHHPRLLTFPSPECRFPRGYET